MLVRPDISFLPAPLHVRRRRSPASALLAALTITAALVPAAGAQQVVKPQPATPGQPRLPAPRVTIDQTPGGCVRLSWEAVEGAKTYYLGRSMGTGGYQRVLDAPDGAFTSYLDRGTRKDVRVSYIVTPVDFNGLAGLRTVSENFIPSASPSADCMTAPAVTVSGPPVVASMEGKDIVVRWRVVEGAYYYEVQPMRQNQPAGPPTRVEWNQEHKFTLRAPAPGQHQFVIFAKTGLGDPVRLYSNRIVVEAPVAPSPADSTGGGTTSTGGTPSTGTLTTAPVAPSEVSLTVGAPVALRVGATAQLPAAAGSRWSSLDAAIATTDGSGVVSAIAPGRARIVAISAQADGAMRITVIHVVVSP